MDIVEEIQWEAEHRAGSPAGFMQVIQLVFTNVEGRKKFLPSLVLCYTPPEDYLPIFREYVSMMQEVLQLRRHTDEVVNGTWKANLDANLDRTEHAKVLGRLRDLTHAARKKARELPIHAYKRLRQLESLKGKDMYLPLHWGDLSERVEIGISNWGEGRDGNHRTATV